MRTTTNNERLEELFDAASVKLPQRFEAVYADNAKAIEQVVEAVKPQQAHFLEFVLPALAETEADLPAALDRLHTSLSTVRGANLWAASIASASDPMKYFVTLTREFDINDSFAEWVAKPAEAGGALEKATKWPAEEMEGWKHILELFGDWKTAAKFKVSDFPLATTGAGFGTEIEVRNQDGTLAAQKGDVILEECTPPTTDLTKLQSYLEKVQAYFKPLEGALQASYWNMHLSIGLSQHSHANVSESLSQYCALAENLTVAANSYERNMYRAKKIDPNNQGSYESTFKINPKMESSAERRSKGLDSARFELKNLSISADTDIPYVIRSAQAIELAAQHPQVMREMLAELQTLSVKHHLPTLSQLRVAQPSPEEIDRLTTSFNTGAEDFRGEALPLLDRYIEKMAALPLAAQQRSVPVVTAEPPRPIERDTSRDHRRHPVQPAPNYGLQPPPPGHTGPWPVPGGYVERLMLQRAAAAQTVDQGRVSELPRDVLAELNAIGNRMRESGVETGRSR